MLGLVGQRLVKRLAVSNAGFAQGLFQRFLVEFLGADEINVGHGGAFLDDHHQHIVLDFQPDVLEEAQAKQRTDGTGALFVVVGFADTKRQRGKDGSRLDALQTLDTNILDRERIHGPGGIGEQ